MDELVGGSTSGFATGGWITKDSGAMAEYADGMKRDTAEDKPRYRLMWPEGVPYTEQLMYRVAALYTRGGKKYGPRNWEKSSTPESLAHHEESLERHVHAFLSDVQDGEDHAAAIVWGINAVLLTRRNIKSAELREQFTQELQEALERSHTKFPEPPTRLDPAMEIGTDGQRYCPDGGTCQGAECGTEGPCTRVLCMGPVSGRFHGDDWPEHIKQEHHDREAVRLWHHNQGKIDLGDDPQDND